MVRSRSAGARGRAAARGARVRRERGARAAGSLGLEAARWKRPLDALFIAAHPDDVELFAGGTVAKLAALGYRVGLCDLTAGELGSNGTPQLRRTESLRAARLLGLPPVRPVLGLPDGGVDARDPQQLGALVALLRTARPRLLFAPAAVDRHPDHEAACELARRAVFFSGLHAQPSGAPAGTPHRPAALAHYICSRDLEPTFLVDVTAHMRQRRAAIRAHASQFKRAGRRPTFINRNGYLAGLEARMAAWGARAGVAFAEGFVLDATPLAHDPVRWLLGESPRRER